MARVDYFSDTAVLTNLKASTMRGGLFVALSQIIRTFLQFLTIPILARLLDPADFGLVAMVTVVTGLAGMFVDAGLSMATVQRSSITRQQVSNLFWIASGLGLLIALLVASSSPAIAWLYNEPRLIWITLAMSASFVFSGLTIQHAALMRRAMQFKQLAFIQALCGILSQGVGVVWAWWFANYWALVLMTLIASLSNMILIWIIVGWRPGWYTKRVGTRTLVSFGATLTGANFVNYFSRNADYMLIGWYWGEIPLGLYERAYRLLLFPLQQVMAPMTAVAIPALSRLKENPGKYRDYFRMGVSLSNLVMIPIVAFSIVMAKPIILTMLGSQWLEAVPIFLALTPAALIATTAPASHWVWISWGQPQKMLYVTFVTATCNVLGFVIALPWGPQAVALSFSIVAVVLRLPVVLYCFHSTPLRLRDQLEPMWRPGYAAMAAGIMLYLLVSKQVFGNAAYWNLIPAILFYGLAYFAFWNVTPQGRNELIQVVGHVKSGMKTKHT